jgi:hypothetical protein
VDKFIATVKNQELREKFFKLLHYILARESIHTKLSRHKRIVRTLDFFKKNGWIRNRSYLMYILPYLSRSFSVDQKHQVFLHHYNITALV